MTYVCPPLTPVTCRRGRGRGKAQPGRGTKARKKVSFEESEPEAESSASDDEVGVEGGGDAAPPKAPVLRLRRKAASPGKQAHGQDVGGPMAISDDGDSEWEDA